MATQQQAMFLDTIIALRKAVKRKAYESDSDESIELNTNRGHKLQKRARFVRKGHLAPSMSPAAYKELVEHAGYQRAIIHRNPPLIDDEGYGVDSDDDEERIQEAMAEAAEMDPYSSINLERKFLTACMGRYGVNYLPWLPLEIYAPLTSVTDLPDHPTLSRPYYSKSLTKLTVQARDLMQKENKALWKVKHLLTRLQGDHTWVPCSMMIEPTDADLFNDDFFIKFLARPLRTETVVSATKSILTHGELPILKALSQKVSRPVTPPTESSQAKEEKGKEADTNKLNGDGAPTSKNGEEDQILAIPAEISSTQQDKEKQREQGGTQPETNGTSPSKENDKPDSETTNHTGKDTPSVPVPPIEQSDVEMEEPPEPQQPNGTNSDQLPIPGSNSLPNGSRAASVTTSAADDLYIHPMFLAPRSARPDRDQALPENEAEDVRRLVQLYVQKQEEVCRGARRLYEGLLRADRYRKTVLRWAKAEAHKGELSDGEDWYDWEEWGLTEDLKKGADEEEEETAPQKKTRNRK